MKTIVKEFTTAILATLLFAVVLCCIYPVIVCGISQLVFPHQANGSLIEGADRKIVGSEWLGQNFTGAKYFHPRPSAAGANGYDAANSSGSNLGPTSQKLMDAVKERVAAYRTENGSPLTPSSQATPSRPAEAASTHTSVPRTPCCKAPASPGSAESAWRW